MSILKSLLGDANQRTVKKYSDTVRQVNELEKKYEQMTDEQLRETFVAFRRESDKTKEYLNEILPDVFALVREASKRTSGKRHYDVQLIGGIALHEGCIAEMRTGEGKTLAATLPAALNAIMGRGVHIITVNDYLARRDTVWMGEIYHFLGLTIGCINHDSSFVYDPTHIESTKSDLPDGKAGIPNSKQIQNSKSETDLDRERDVLGSFKIVHEFLRPATRVEAYRADITYGTNNEYGFDWLRDNLVVAGDQIRQQDHYFAIVDEVDSILIDEARTPLIISAPDEEAEDLYKVFSGVAPKLKKDEDFTVDEKMRAVLVNDAGISKVEKMLGIEDIYTEKGVRYVRHLEQALRAEALFQKDRHYVIRDGQVIIVDEFTGRLMPGRRWSDGLHQAIEAKENVAIQQESRTLATITFQNYFRMYEKLSGMTGTAQTSSEEFYKVYNLNVVSIPTHMPMIRKDHQDKIYQSENGKFQAVVKEVKGRHERGQPVLLGTASIEKNEKLSELLRVAGVPHNILNAKNHEREAEITAQAGRFGAVTLATNIAGRGVDIILGGTPPDLTEAEKVKQLGGLFVLGTERHEARRIDNQLRGRSGRQGDPGESQFFLSLEDELMRIFAPERIKNMMGRFGIPEDEPIQARLVSRAIEQAQEKIEGLHFDSRKHLLEYDNVLSKQRQAVYRMRREMLTTGAVIIENKIDESLANFAKTLIEIHQGEEGPDVKSLGGVLSSLLGKSIQIPEGELEQEILKILKDELAARMEKDKPGFLENSRVLFMQIIDMMWRDHLEVMEYTRSSVGLRAYGQRDPLVEYKNEAHRLYRTFNANLTGLFIDNLFKINVGAHLHMHEQKGITNEQRQVAERVMKNADGKKVGRNDPCPCGAINPQTGRVYKYKQCGLANAPHHKK